MSVFHETLCSSLGKEPAEGSISHNSNEPLITPEDLATYKAEQARLKHIVELHQTIKDND